MLERITLDVEPRAFVALVGPSGCGKTTFLRMLLGEEAPREGRYCSTVCRCRPSRMRPRRGVSALLGLSASDRA